jgi:hypothetical protein
MNYEKRLQKDEPEVGSMATRFHGERREKTPRFLVEYEYIATLTSF